MELGLYEAIGNLLYHPASAGPDLRLFMANFGPVQYDDDGLPVDMTVDADAPAYNSPGMAAGYAGFQDGLSVDDMWVILDEAWCVRDPSWAWARWHRHVAFGRSPRLLVPAQDGQRLLCVRKVVEPPDEPDSDDSEDDTDTDSDDGEDDPEPDDGEDDGDDGGDGGDGGSVKTI